MAIFNGYVSHYHKVSGNIMTSSLEWCWMDGGNCFVFVNSWLQVSYLDNKSMRLCYFPVPIILMISWGLVAEVKSLLRAGKKLSEAQGGDVVSVNLSFLANVEQIWKALEHVSLLEIMSSLYRLDAVLCLHIYIYRSFIFVFVLLTYITIYIYIHLSYRSWISVSPG